MKYYKIGVIANLLDLTTQALRFYEQEGVVTPVKSENGTRLYSLDDVHKLLSFRKYRMAEFTVQDVVAHLRNDSLRDLSSRLDEKCDELIARSEEMLRRAHELRNFRQELDYARRNLGVLRVETRPEFYVQTTSLDQLDQATSDIQMEIKAYIDALPATSIAFTRDVALLTPVRYAMCVTKESAQRWGLSLAHTQVLKPVCCVASYIEFPHTYNADQPIQELMERVQLRYRLKDDEPILSLHVASETPDKTIMICGKVYIPIEA